MTFKNNGAPKLYLLHGALKFSGMACTPQWIIPAVIITLVVLVIVPVFVVSWMLGRRRGGVPTPITAVGVLFLTTQILMEYYLAFS
jgi:uncharacterized membrane protein YtjA (UPF0391 family)